VKGNENQVEINESLLKQRTQLLEELIELEQ